MIEQSIKEKIEGRIIYLEKGLQEHGDISKQFRDDLALLISDVIPEKYTFSNREGIAIAKREVIEALKAEAPNHKETRKKLDQLVSVLI